MRPLNIFVSHSSDLLTDCEPHGDGLAANAFVRTLAARGHTLHLAVGATKIRTPFPENVHLHQVITSQTLDVKARVQFVLRSRALFRRLHQKERFDIIHQLNPVVTGLSAALIGIRVPIVMGPYVPDWPTVLEDGSIRRQTLTSRTFGFVKQFIIELQHRQADAVIVSSKAALNTKVRSPGRMRDKVHVLPFGVDAEAFSPENRVTGQNVLYLASLSHHKGLFVLLKAFSKVHERFPNCRLKIAGQGRAEQEARLVAAQSRASDCIDFVGPVSRQDVTRLMNECSVYCLPSYAEAFGLSALEAMACGRPVVITDAGGLAHIVCPEGSRKVPVRDADKLASALIEILADPELGERMGVANRKMVEQVYAWPRVVLQLENIYAQVLDCRAPEVQRRSPDPMFQENATL